MMLPRGSGNALAGTERCGGEISWCGGMRSGGRRARRAGCRVRASASVWGAGVCLLLGMENQSSLERMRRGGGRVVRVLLRLEC
jgi:hypothetical protein